jgi:PAS domain-containing protein
LTAHGDERTAVESIKAGALDYVVKSKETLAGTPQIAQHVLREWRHIAERRRAEEALRQSENQARAIIQTANDAFIAIDEGGTITDWNPQAEILFGWSRSEAFGRRLTETVIPAE